MMKLISKTVLLLVISACAHGRVIYGVDGIERFQHRSIKTPLYVQMGSFSNARLAAQYQHQLSAKTNTAVSVKSDHGKYQVLVGPFKQYAALKRFHDQYLTQQAKPRLAMNEPIVQKPESAIAPIEMRVAPVKSSKWFINAQVGGQANNSGATARVNNNSGQTAPYDQDIYTTTTNNTNVSPLVGLQIGHRWELTQPWLTAFSLGAQYQYFFASDINGQVMQFSLPEFTNYNYSWRKGSNLIIANAKLNFIDYKRFSPYFNGGIGAVLNNDGHYTENAQSGVTPRISPNFGNNSSAQFAYILGAGIDYQFSSDLIMNAGYQYSHLGQLNSGTGAESWAAQHLNFGNYQSNAFLFGLTYLFDMDNPVSFIK